MQILLQKQHTPKLQTHSSRSVCCDEVLFFCFFGCLEDFFGFQPKVAKTSRKQKNKKFSPMYPLGLAVLFFLFFWFSRSFFWFSARSSKPRENKNKKNKKFSPMYPLGLAVFFCFLEVFGFVAQQMQMEWSFIRTDVHAQEGRYGWNDCLSEKKLSMQMRRQMWGGRKIRISTMCTSPPPIMPPSVNLSLE